jgi:dienelactone hydrolase
MDKGIKSSRIVLGGFSQGGAMSVFAGVTNKEKLGGVFGLSCYMLLSDRIKNYIPENWPNKDTPVFLAHGDEDETVPHVFGKQSAKMWKDLGVENVVFNTYPYVGSRCLVDDMLTRYSDLGHSADPIEIDDLEKFLMKTLPMEGQASAGL